MKPEIQQYGALSDEAGNDVHMDCVADIVNDSTLFKLRTVVGLQIGHPRVYREVIFVAISLFMGYAALVSNQKKLYDRWESNVGSTLTNVQKQWYEHGTSLVYFGNLLFRLLHNFLFAPITPRMRVVVSLLCMSFALGTLISAYWLFSSTSVVFVYAAYLTGGIGIGSFESNFLATITPLGHETKLWAMMGISVGFVTITVGGYAFMAATHLDMVYIYAMVCVSCLLSVLLWVSSIPILSSQCNVVSSSEFVSHIVSWREWLRSIRWYCLAMLINMFCVSYNTAINQYIYDGRRFPLLGELWSGTTWMVEQNVFLALLNFFQFVGDLSGRKLIYYFKLTVHPCWFLSLSFVGLLGCMTKVPAIALGSTMLVMLANGSIYSSSTYFMDTHSKNNMRKYLLTSMSIWLFIGDIGSVMGSNVWELIVPAVCSLPPASSQYFCTVD